MVSKKSFTLLVDTGTIPFFAVVPILSDGDCSISGKWIEVLRMGQQQLM